MKRIIVVRYTSAKPCLDKNRNKPLVIVATDDKPRAMKLASIAEVRRKKTISPYLSGSATITRR